MVNDTNAFWSMTRMLAYMSLTSGQWHECLHSCHWPVSLTGCKLSWPCWRFEYFSSPQFHRLALFPSTQEQLERGGRMDFQCHINLPPPHQPSYFYPKKHKLTTLLYSPTKNINLKPSYFHPQLTTTPSLLFSPTIPSLSDLIFLLWTFASAEIWD